MRSCIGWMWMSQERNGMVPRRSNDQEQVPISQTLFHCRTLVHGSW